MKPVLRTVPILMALKVAKRGTVTKTHAIGNVKRSTGGHSSVSVKSSNGQSMINIADNIPTLTIADKLNHLSFLAFIPHRA